MFNKNIGYMKTLLMFPGQGSQYVGMGKDIFDNYKYAKKIFQKVDETLDENFSNLIFTGDENELKKSYNTQPALMVVSVAIYLSLKEECGTKLDRLNIQGVAGHSLGEYSALCVAGGLSIEDTTKILRYRGKAMFDCVSNDTGMCAVIGSDKDTIQQAIDNIKPKCLVIANSNSIGQIVVSGYLEDIEKFKIEISGKTKKLIQLPVSGAFHSPLMQKAQSQVEIEIEKLNVKQPSVDILQNYSGKFENNVDTIKNNLKKQITAPVLWCENMQMAIEQGFDAFIEIGAKNVLTGLLKRIVPEDKKNEIKIINIEKVEDIKNLSSLLD